jgi:predicted dehydrogenase
MKDTLDIFLSNARIHCDFSRSTLLQAYAPDPTPFADEYLVEKLETKAGWSYPSVDEEWLLGYHHELTDFVEAVRYDRAPLSDGRLGRAVVAVIYSAYLSAAAGRPVELASAA